MTTLIGGRKGLIAVLVLSLAASFSQVGADGGHNDPKHGGYHVHNWSKYYACHPDAATCKSDKSDKLAASEKGKPETPKQDGATAAPSTTAPKAASAAETEQAEERVYVTRTGKKYHREGCRYLSKSKIPMELKKAAAQYAPCKVCRPPVPKGKEGE